MNNRKGLPEEGFDSPLAMASSIAKRYVQIRKALPQSDQEELFQFILDNRYKLKGHVVSIAERKKNISNSFGSLTLLTLNTIMSENEGARESLSSDPNLVEKVLKSVYDLIQLETEGGEDMSMENILLKAKNII